MSFHAGLPVSGGFIGVDVFFVISGFVITSLLLRELHMTDRIDLLRFYLRRIRRLLPALAATSLVVATLSIPACPLSSQELTALTVMAASIFSANGFLYHFAPGYFNPGSDLNPMLHTWSLSVEEQFYLLFPSLLVVAWRCMGRSASTSLRRRFTLCTVLALSLVSFTSSWAMTSGHTILPGIHGPINFAFFSSPTRAWEFGTGALLSLAVPPCPHLPRWLASATGILGAAFIAIAALTFKEFTPFPGSAALLPVAGTISLLLSGAAPPVGVTRILSTAPATWLGDRSYSWYLWHWPCVVFARALWPHLAWAPLTASVLSLAMASISYRFIETPIRLAPYPSRRNTLVLALGCVIAPLLASGALLWTRQVIRATPPGRQFTRATQLHADVLRGCDGPGTYDNQEERCTWRISGSHGRILLLGDSNAGQFAEPFIQASHRTGYDAEILTQHACPFVDLLASSHGKPNLACRSFIARSLAAIEAHPPKLVLLALASDHYIGEVQFTLKEASPAREESASATTPEDKARLWTRGLQSILARVNRVAPVIVIHPVVRFPGWTLGACPAANLFINPASCGAEISRTDYEARRWQVVASEQRAVASASRTSTLDFTEFLCQAAVCSTNIDGAWAYRDGRHLSIPGALRLTAPIAKAIAERALP